MSKYMSKYMDEAVERLNTFVLDEKNWREGSGLYPYKVEKFLRSEIERVEKKKNQSCVCECYYCKMCQGWAKI